MIYDHFNHWPCCRFWTVLGEARLSGARYLIADRDYNANALRSDLRRRGTVTVIPGRANRTRTIT